MADDTVDIDEASRDAIIAAVSSSPEVIAAKLKLAEKAAEYAKAIAPVKTGTYRDSIKVHQRGPMVWVGFNDEKSHLIEWGSIDTPEFAVRGKTEEHINNDG